MRAQWGSALVAASVLGGGVSGGEGRCSLVLEGVLEELLPCELQGLCWHPWCPVVCVSLVVPVGAQSHARHVLLVRGVFLSEGLAEGWRGLGWRAASARLCVFVQDGSLRRACWVCVEGQKERLFEVGREL